MFSGWGAVSLCRNIDKSKFEVTCVSPRNYFLMTPLLASVAVGTIENRCDILHASKSSHALQRRV